MAPRQRLDGYAYQECLNKARGLNCSYSTSMPSLFRPSILSKSPTIYEESPAATESEQELRRIQTVIQTGSEEAYNKALNELEDAMERLNLLRLNDDSNEEDVIKAMREVTAIQWDLGMLKEAQAIQEEILAKLIAIHSPEETANSSDPPKHMDIASTMHTIGSIQARMNNPIEAKKWFDASLKIKEELLQEYAYHFEIGKTLNGLALVKMQLDQENGDDSDPFSVIQILIEAENHYVYHGESPDDEGSGNSQGEETKEDYADHPQVAYINENIATLYRKHGDLRNAHGRYENALRIRRNLDHDDSVMDCKLKEQIINLMVDCGDCLSGMEQYDEALKRYQEALKLHMLVVQHQRKQGRTDAEATENGLQSIHAKVTTPLAGVLKHNIGMMQAYLGKYEEATAAYMDALSIKRTYGEDHPEVGITFNAIGAMYGAKGDTDSAMEYFQKALDIFRMHCNPSDNEDLDENIFCTKKNIERIEKSLGGMSGAIGSGRRSRF